MSTYSLQSISYKQNKTPLPLLKTPNNNSLKHPPKPSKHNKITKRTKTKQNKTKSRLFCTGLHVLICMILTTQYLHICTYMHIIQCIHSFGICYIVHIKEFQHIKRKFQHTMTSGINITHMKEFYAFHIKLSVRYQNKSDPIKKFDDWLLSFSLYC